MYWLRIIKLQSSLRKKLQFLPLIDIVTLFALIKRFVLAFYDSKCNEIIQKSHTFSQTKIDLSEKCFI